MRRLWVIALLALLGCEAPPSAEPGPQPEPYRPADPPPEPARTWSGPTGAVALHVDPIGRLWINDKEVLYLVTALDDEQRKAGPELAIRLEVAPQTPWREVVPVVAACRKAGVRNLHWRVARDPRPAVPWPLFPPGRSARAGIVGVSWDADKGEPSHLWRPLAGLLGPHDPDPPRRPLTRAEVVAEVRATRARRVYLQIAPLVPFSEVFEIAEALRDTGTLLSFDQR
ncbi:MAG: hypothetical protein JKY65_27270 [Planctomycetes bacterium]|nr:hypothetical protein [Planctomycetota bacterium]